MAYKSVKQYEVFRENPFVEKAIQDIKIVKKTQVIRPKNKDEIQLIVSSAGDVEGHSAFMRYIEVDEEKFTKLYLSQFTSFWELSKAAIRVFGYIISILKPKQDEFFLEMNRCLEYTKYKHPKDVLSGIANLIECGIVARSDSHFKYFINPLVIFNGDRVTFAKTYIKKKKQADHNQLNLVDQIDYKDKIEKFEAES
ncbi:RepA protein [Rhodocytophaga aerolata]|uniref:RepA protein n=1 Tax=Rhodocytophaga aerolata TaxID=455078 RepID=A0ABT8RHS5_9BACT|nr:RepA protein [Rhodocytophaga aerolata]MDO1451519.1 RepA protein [Rhodocytophaga aerolata]